MKIFLALNRKDNMYKVMLILILSCGIIVAQEIDEKNFKVQLKGGINYLLKSEYETAFVYPKVDKKQPGINFGFNIVYLINPNNFLLSGIEFIETRTTAKNKYSNAEWIFRSFPVSFGYQYNFVNNISLLYPYISVNIAYVISTVKFTQTSSEDDRPNYKHTENGFGVDGNIGLVYIISTKIDIISELKLRYANASFFTEESKYPSIEFSGIYLYIGLNYNF